MIFVIFVAILIIVIIVHQIKSGKKDKSKTDLSKTSEVSNARTVSFDLSVAESISKIPVYFIFDCETTGLPVNRYAGVKDLSNWPFIVQIAWGLFDELGKAVTLHNYIVSQKIRIPESATMIHGITNSRMKKEGIAAEIVYSKLLEDVSKVNIIVSHNIDFDLPILQAELIRNGLRSDFHDHFQICTMLSSIHFCNLKRTNGSLKYPKLSELIGCLFFDNPYVSLNNAHDAYFDLLTTRKAFFEMDQMGLLSMEVHRYSSQEYGDLQHIEKIANPPKPDYGRIKQSHITDDKLLAEYGTARANFNYNWKLLYGTNNNPLNVCGKKKFALEFNLSQSKKRLENAIEKIKKFNPNDA